MPWLRIDIQYVTLIVAAVVLLLVLAAAGSLIWRLGGMLARREVVRLHHALEQAQGRSGARERGAAAGLAATASDLSHRLPAFVGATREQLSEMSVSPQVRARQWDVFLESTLAGLAELESYGVRLKAMVISSHDGVALNLRSHDVVRVVEEARVMAQALIARHAGDLRFEISVKRRPVIALCDRRVLSGVVTSLLDNAARYAGKSGASRVSVEINGALPNSGEPVVIAVGDDGAKFTQEELERLGGEGQRGVVGRGSEGTGLTLWYLWQAIEQMNGEFAIRNRPEGEDGKYFEIRLPASQMRAEE